MRRAAVGSGPRGRAPPCSSAGRAGPRRRPLCGIEVARPDFAAVTVTALDGRPLAESKKILIAACGKCENTDMKFSADRQTVGREWGKAPVRIEPVDGRVVLPAGAWTCRALRPDGTPAGDVPVAKDEKGAPLVRLSAEHKTMWYLVTPAK